MTRIDIFSGFLGAGKTTLIRKLIAEAYQGEKLVRSLGVSVFGTVIRRTDKVPESTMSLSPLAEYSPGSAEARDYRALVRELLEV